MIQQIAGIPGILLGTWMVESFLGRKWTTFFTFIASGVCVYIFTLSEEPVFVCFKQVLVITAFYYFFVYLSFAALYTFEAESFPSEIRNRGVGFVGVLARIGGVVAPVFTGGLLEYENGVLLVLYSYAFSYITSGVLMILLKETRVRYDKVRDA
jgi:nitrate/nitrite transporter NarK